MLFESILTPFLILVIVVAQQLYWPTELPTIFHPHGRFPSLGKDELRSYFLDTLMNLNQAFSISFSGHLCPRILLSFPSSLVQSSLILSILKL